MESATHIVMETEPVFASLANIMKHFDNLTPSDDLQRFQLEEIEV
jgi:hypothetical protein